MLAVIQQSGPLLQRRKNLHLGAYLRLNAALDFRQWSLSRAGSFLLRLGMAELECGLCEGEEAVVSEGASWGVVFISEPGNQSRFTHTALSDLIISWGYPADTPYC